MNMSVYEWPRYSQAQICLVYVPKWECSFKDSALPFYKFLSTTTNLSLKMIGTSSDTYTGEFPTNGNHSSEISRGYITVGSKQWYGQVFLPEKLTLSFTMFSWPQLIILKQETEGHLGDLGLRNPIREDLKHLNSTQRLPFRWTAVDPNHKVSFTRLICNFHPQALSLSVGISQRNLFTISLFPNISLLKTL